jgi:hypothetical protein
MLTLKLGENQDDKTINFLTTDQTKTVKKVKNLGISNWADLFDSKLCHPECEELSVLLSRGKRWTTHAYTISTLLINGNPLP